MARFIVRLSGAFLIGATGERTLGSDFAMLLSTL